jgi:hypothetical protein
MATIADAKKRIEKIFSKYKDSEVRVGYLDGATYNDGTPLWEVARKHENGIDVPKRPFMTEARDINLDKWKRGLTRNLTNGVPMDKALGRLGEQMIGDITRHILQGNWGDNTPATVARKGFNKPLVDTGAMNTSVEYEVIINGDTVYSAYSAKKPEPAQGRKGNKKKFRGGV